MSWSQKKELIEDEEVDIYKWVQEEIKEMSKDKFVMAYNIILKQADES